MVDGSIFSLRTIFIINKEIKGAKNIRLLILAVDVLNFNAVIQTRNVMPISNKPEYIAANRLTVL